jgi:acid phosphatase type 7
MKRREFIGLSGLGIATGAASMATNARAEDTAESAVEPLAFLVPPYLQEPNPESMTVMWLLNRRDSLSWVEYGVGDDLTEKAFTDVDGLIDADDHIHKIRLKDLKPGTRYQYRVVSKVIDKFGAYDVRYGETLSSDTFSFTTPEAGQEECACIIFNDIHENMPLYKTLHGIGSQKPYDFAIFNGDVMNHLDDESQLVDRALRPFAESFGGEVPYVYTRGNHDIRGRFARQLNDYIASPGDSNFYSFDYGPVHFLVMDLGEDKPDDHPEYGGLVSFGPYRAAQREWLTREIETKECKKAAFRVLIAHIPMYGTRYTETLCKDLWGDLLNKGKIDLHLAGHTHRYTQIPAGEDKLDCPILIGGGPKAGKATVMRLTANRKEMNVVMTRDDGEVVATETVRAR